MVFWALSRNVVSSLLTAGLTLMLVFIILSGAINSSPIDKFYWLEADTSSISGAPAMSKWTFWGLSESVDGSTKHVDLQPGYPISPVDNFGTTENIPQDFIDNRNTYYYLTRVGFGLFFVALGFTACSLLLLVISFCSSAAARIHALFIAGSFLFTLAAVALFTAASAKAKNTFSNAGLYAKLGQDMYGIAWASVAVSLILFLLTSYNCCVNSYKDYRNGRREDNEARERYESAVQKRDAREAEKQQESLNANSAGYEQNQGTIPAATESTAIKFFKINRNQKDYPESD
ncbi:hypothetical protein WICPIJ_001587 [Wickerhamomyces pijperi]|uniref:Uncharacterized protein n=1 Tax=Wickerhamomyces pijperi TaxID=599730 RepID=A0A9P8TQG9_WICPI|nr:hypothetical protein WICPIJ_001587 [Wickerhamomyces pijperi]